MFAQSELRRGTRASALATALLAAIASTTVACSSGTHASTATSPPVAASNLSGTARARIGDLSLTGGYIPAPASPDVAAAYFTVTNSGAVADTITAVTTNVTRNVMAMTETTSGGVGTMTDLASVTVPAHGQVTLTPGHAHLMLQSPNRSLKQGDTVTMTITFAHAGTVTVTLPVVPLTGPAITSGPMSGMPGMG